MPKRNVALAVLVALVMVMGLVPAGAVVASNDAPNWDISGTWVLDFAGGTDNREFVDLVQDDEGNVEGSFWWMNNDDKWEYGGTLDGYVSGCDLYFYYDRDPINYTGEFFGTITKYGMSGTFERGTLVLNWSTAGSPTLLWEARVSGGGQLLAESEVWHRNGRNIPYQISFGGGSYIVNGEYWFDGLEVTFHHVSDEDVMGGKFVGTSLLAMDFGFTTDGVANYQVAGEFNGEPGYRMMIRVQDSGEPGFEDNLRFELYYGGTTVYDSFQSGDFPGESSDHGTARNTLDRGNIQVQDLR